MTCVADMDTILEEPRSRCSVVCPVGDSGLTRRLHSHSTLISPSAFPEAAA